MTLVIRFAVCVVAVLLLMIWVELTTINKSLKTISGALVDTGRLGGPLNRIDHNIGVIGDYGIPVQEPNAPRVVR